MPSLTITIVPKEIGELWDELLQQFLADVCRAPRQIPNRPLEELIPNKYNPRYNLHIGQCHKQYTPNLCGYHATFNTLCFLHLLRGGETHNDLLSGASFWSFKRRMESFLLDVKQANKLKDEWPWREKDIFYGDFERTYNKICLQLFEEFDIFRSHLGFDLQSFTWEFQFQNLLLNEDKRRELNTLIRKFRSQTGSRPIVISFMLAITNHWMCLLAVRRGSKEEFWFFDSNNRDVLDLSPEQIQELVEQLSQERMKRTGEPYTAFFRHNIGVCMRDTQISLKLIIDCLQGRTTIEEYVYNQQFNIFAKQIDKNWADSHSLQVTLRDYAFNITAFFKGTHREDLLTEQNRIKIKKWERGEGFLTQSQEGCRLQQLARRFVNNTRI